VKRLVRIQYLMPANEQNISPHGALLAASRLPAVSAIIPARNEEAVIATCIESLARQQEISEIVVVDDQSTDRTAGVVRNLIGTYPHLRLLQTDGLPDGWVGKNYALWNGMQPATGAWLLFTDADAEHQSNSAARALQIAQEHQAALVSFSPEQVTENWYEKALIPYIYLRLAKLFSYDEVNDPKSHAAAANGQFLMIRRDVYDAIGGHAGVAGEVLEDVAIAMRVKAAGHRIWFASGKGIVRVRMYRSFDSMWQGWKKNLYRLVSGTPWAAFREIESSLPWIPLLLILIGLKFPLVFFFGVLLLLGRQAVYGLELVRNHFPFSFIFYYVPAAFLYSGVLWASYRSHAKGRIEWKGREYAIGAPESIK
jgi:glycosyltransferase involved in cell wall biosynthesis